MRVSAVVRPEHGRQHRTHRSRQSSLVPGPLLISFPRSGEFSCGYPTFVATFVVANLLMFGGPLYSFAASTTQASSWSGVTNLLVLTGLQVVLMVVALTAASLFSLRAMKGVCIAFLACNAVALYFIHTYNVLLDKSMIGNVFDTDRQEALGLFHPRLLGYVLVLGVMPALVVTRTTILGSSRPRRLLMLVMAVVLGCAMVYSGSSTWLWFDKGAKQLGGLMLPWSYVANSIRYFEDRATANRKQAPLPPLHFPASTKRAPKTIVVLVIGESARAGNFSIYGYDRATNPELARTSVIALPGARACATYTTAAVRCMLSRLGSRTPARVSEETLPNYLQREGVQVIWRTNNWGEPPLKVGLYQRLADIRKACIGEECQGLNYDAGLLHGLEAMLTHSTSSRIFVVLHQAGSHGPTYSRKYPPAFGHFQPVCESVDLAQCSQQSLVNAYDNTIVYTDYVLAQTIKLLQAVPGSASVMIYMSDHGESLGESGFYLHGLPNSIAPTVQRAVPFLVWMSPTAKVSLQVSAGDILAHRTFGPDNIFHSVLGAFGGSSAIYDPRLDLFNHPRSTDAHGTTTPSIQAGFVPSRLVAGPGIVSRQHLLPQ
ncbi:MAG: phosphoethanolamine--lipid A transferase EptA [Luteimonas sp.]